MPWGGFKQKTHSSQILPICHPTQDTTVMVFAGYHTVRLTCCFHSIQCPFNPLLYSSDTMSKQLPLTAPYFATEEENNILNNTLPMQATMHNGGHPDLLVCPPILRNRIAEMWLHQAEMVCVTVPASPLSYEDGSEVVCVGWGRMTRSLPHQTSSTTEPSSEVENNLGATGTHGHTTHHYTPQLLQLPTETTTINTPAPFIVNAHFSCECHSDEEGECRPKNGIPREAVGDPPPTQQLVSGRMI